MKQAAREKYPDAQSIEWNFKELKVDGLVVALDGLAEREAELVASNEWLVNRREAYAALGNQFEMQYDDMAGWRQAIADIKSQYPKPSE